MKTPIAKLIVLLAPLLALSAPVASAQSTDLEYQGAAALGLKLRQLGPTERVLMIAAHPDDESTQILSELALGAGAEVAYLALTRGEGGQNGIGPELQESLGLLRTGELLAARRLDGARQFFTRAYDYGYSKSADEAFRHWPRDEVLADVIAVIRQFRPDVIISIFSGTPRDGHGQHEAAGILTREAFDAAADPSRFPDQITDGLEPHRTGKLYMSLRGDPGGEVVRLETGEMDPLLGRSAYQVAMLSRSRHRSQDMGRIAEPGAHTSSLVLVESRVGTAVNGNGIGGDAALFAGLPTTLAEHAAGRGADVIAILNEYEKLVREIREMYSPLRPGEIVPQLADAVDLLDRASVMLDASGDDDLAFRIEQEREQASEALRAASGILLDAISADETVTPGQTFELRLSLWNGGDNAVTLRSLTPDLPPGWSAEPLAPIRSTIAAGEYLEQIFRVTVPTDAEITEPYFLKAPRDGDLYRWPEERGGVGIPFQAPPVRAQGRLEIAGAAIDISEEATFQTVDKMFGELRRPVRVVPPATVAVEPQILVVSTAATESVAPLEVSVTTAAGTASGIAGELRLDLPPGWRSEPETARLELDFEGASKTTDFRIFPTRPLAPGEYRITAVFHADGGDSFSRGYQLVDYPHTRPRSLYSPSITTVEAFEVRIPEGLSVAYVPGAGDEIPQAMAQLGLTPDILDAEALSTADLDRFDVIVTGIRAYEVNPALVAANHRMLQYVEDGGTLIVQYNKYEYDELDVTPYPTSMSRPHDRVTDENAPVTVLDESQQVVSWPNEITSADFEGWIQERGLYFLSEWDPRFVPVLEMSDPGEAPLRGSLLIAPYGEGKYVYTGLSFFRELPAGVPGAYRLFANLLALGATK